ncbi:PilZ domain-containing protein [bacterium]|nr:PilZ domain-containing protein [bacterium]
MIGTSETGRERRSYPRLPLKLRLQYNCIKKGNITSLVETQSEDFGTGGLTMRSKQRVKIGQILMVTLLLPSRGENKSAGPIDIGEERYLPVAVLSRVAWCRYHTEKEYRLGIQFLALTLANRKSLINFFSDYSLDWKNSPLMN